MTEHITLEVYRAYQDWALQKINEGWAPYLLTFMYKQLAGSPSSISSQMDDEVCRCYALLLSRIARNPHAAVNKGRLPLWIVCSDWPVSKAQKDNFRDLHVNDGEHRHAIALVPPNSRLTSLDDFIDQEQWRFSGEGKRLFRLHCEPITETPEKAIGYVLKSLKRRRIDADGVLALAKISQRTPPMISREPAN